MKQNIYDESDFFAKYSEMPRSVGGLKNAMEWPALRALLPELRGKRVLDLGCGYGWHCRYLREQGAQSVVGVDISAKMLSRAREMTNDAAIAYRQVAIEEIDFPAGAFDVVFSSLALHYVEHYAAVCRKVHACLVPGGAFVMSVEHPIFTAVPEQDWYRGPDGEPLHWPVDNYHRQGRRATKWLADGVIKYHRTVEAHISGLLDAGFELTRLVEPAPPAQDGEWAGEWRRPIFLLLAAVRD